MIYFHVRIDYLFCFYDFPNECRLRIGHVDLAERMFCHWSKADFFWRSTVLHSRKTQRLQRTMLHVWVALFFSFRKVQHLHFQASVSPDIIVFILVSQTVRVLSWKSLEDFYFLNVFIAPLLVIMLQFKMNHKWTRVLTHVKDRKHLSSKCIFWVLCWISDYIFF